MIRRMVRMDNRLLDFRKIFEFLNTILKSYRAFPYSKRIKYFQTKDNTVLKNLKQSMVGTQGLKTSTQETKKFQRTGIL